MCQIIEVSGFVYTNALVRRTLALHTSPVDTGAPDYYIMYDGQCALAANPLTPFVLDLAIIEHSGLVQPNAPAVNGPSESYFVWMKVFPT